MKYSRDLQASTTPLSWGALIAGNRSQAWVVGNIYTTSHFILLLDVNGVCRTLPRFHLDFVQGVSCLPDKIVTLYLNILLAGFLEFETIAS